MMREFGMVYLLNNFLMFVRRPSLNLDIPIFDFKTKLRHIAILMSWVYAVIFPLAIVIGLALNLFEYSGTNSVSEFTQSNPWWVILFVGAIVAPFIEEMTFRLWLRFDVIFISLFSFLIMRIVVRLFSNYFEVLKSGYMNLVILLAAYIVFTLLRITRIQQKVRYVYDNHFRVLFYVSFVSFGLLHVFNYSDTQNLAFLVMLITLPQTIVGLVLGYVRIQYGFWYGFFMHAIYNGILLVPAALALNKDNLTSNYLLLLIVFGIFLIFLYGIGSLITTLFQVFVRHRVN